MEIKTKLTNVFLSDDLTSSQKLIYAALYDYSIDKEKVKMSYALISERTSLGLRTVITNVKLLEEKRYINIHRCASRNRTNLYAL